MNNILYTVDYFSDKRLRITLPFSTYEWALMNVLSVHKDKTTLLEDPHDYYMDYLQMEQT